MMAYVHYENSQWSTCSQPRTQYCRGKDEVSSCHVKTVPLLHQADNLLESLVACAVRNSCDCLVRGHDNYASEHRVANSQRGC